LKRVISLNSYTLVSHFNKKNDSQSKVTRFEVKKENLLKLISNQKSNFCHLTY
jgi:hypothetical protein